MVANQVRKENNPASYHRGVALLIAELPKSNNKARLRQLFEGLETLGTLTP